MGFSFSIFTSFCMCLRVLLSNEYVEWFGRPIFIQYELLPYRHVCGPFFVHSFVSMFYMLRLFHIPLMRHIVAQLVSINLLRLDFVLFECKFHFCNFPVIFLVLSILPVFVTLLCVCMCVWIKQTNEIEKVKDMIGYTVQLLGYFGWDTINSFIAN